MRTFSNKSGPGPSQEGIKKVLAGIIAAEKKNRAIHIRNPFAIVSPSYYNFLQKVGVIDEDGGLIE